ncbi:hypothetical protein C8R43DRAFT_46221 [Mycena crocata]|nr:hypothetical protein C8R43DRAFT_46221 [Mycena crocata]
MPNLPPILLFSAPDSASPILFVSAALNGTLTPRVSGGQSASPQLLPKLKISAPPNSSFRLKTSPAYPAHLKPLTSGTFSSALIYLFFRCDKNKEMTERSLTLLAINDIVFPPMPKWIQSGRTRPRRLQTDLGGAILGQTPTHPIADDSTRPNMRLSSHS